MAKRLRDVCALPESEPLWRAGRGFVVRDLPWTVEKLRVIPPFEFENWAVIALGTSPTKCRWATWAWMAAFVPHLPDKSELPEPAWVKKIRLQGISGLPDHRLASINDKSFEKGDQIVLKVDGNSVKVSCLDVRESSVSVSIEGIEGARELKISGK